MMVKQKDCNLAISF